MILKDHNDARLGQLWPTLDMQAASSCRLGLFWFFSFSLFPLEMRACVIHSSLEIDLGSQEA